MITPSSSGSCNLVDSVFAINQAWLKPRFLRRCGGNGTAIIACGILLRAAIKVVMALVGSNNNSASTTKTTG